MDKETALVEAILFLESEPLSEEAISIIGQLSKDVVEIALENLKERYSSEACGFELSQITGGWVLTPKKDLWNFLKEKYGKKNEGKLSKSAMEIRGVSADNMVRLLMERNLIRETGKKDVPGKPIQYGTTKEFLKFFRLNSIADLPKLDETESERFELAR